MSFDFSINLPPLDPPPRPDPRVERARRAPGTAGLSDNLLRMVEDLEHVAGAQASMAQMWLGQGREDRALAAFGQALEAMAAVRDGYARFSLETRIFNRFDRDAKQYGATQLAAAVHRARLDRLR